MHPWADVVLPEPEHDAGVMAAAGQLWATADRPRPLRRVPARRHRRRARPGDAGGDGRARRRRLLGAGLVGLRAGPAGAAHGRPDAGRARRLDARLPGRCLRRPRGADRRRVAGQRDQRSRGGGLRAARRPAGRRAADRGGVATVAGGGGPGRRSASGSGVRRRCVLRAVAGGLLHLGPLPGRPGRASRFRRRDDGTLGRAGRLLRRRDAAHRRRPPRPRHVRLHPHALRPRCAGARRRGRAGGSDARKRKSLRSGPMRRRPYACRRGRGRRSTASP